MGIDFAHKYTGLENTVAAQVSLVKLTLNQRSVTTLLHYFMALKPVLARYMSCIPEPYNCLMLMAAYIYLCGVFHL